MTIVPIEHISLDERGVAYIAGTRIKVRHIAIAHTEQGFSPVEMREAYPHLSLAQIYAALAYYHDHKPEVDAEIVEADRYAEELRAQQPNPLTREMLEARLRERNHPGPSE